MGCGASKAEAETEMSAAAAVDNNTDKTTPGSDDEAGIEEVAHKNNLSISIPSGGSAAKESRSPRKSKKKSKEKKNDEPKFPLSPVAKLKERKKSDPFKAKGRRNRRASTGIGILPSQQDQLAAFAASLSGADGTQTLAARGKKDKKHKKNKHRDRRRSMTGIGDFDMSTISSRKFGRHSTKTSLHTDKDERKSKAGSPSGPTSGHRRRRKSITDNDIGNSLQVPGAKKKGFAMRRKSFKKLIDAKSAEELQQMDRVELMKLYDQYDIHQKGVLDKGAMKRLATDSIGKTLRIFENELRVDNPDLNQKQIQELVEKERFFLLPGKNREESDKAMCDMLMKHLDVDNSGEVTREEFVMRWNNFAQALFADHQAIDHSLECSVM